MFLSLLCGVVIPLVCICGPAKWEGLHFFKLILLGSASPLARASRTAGLFRIFRNILLQQPFLLA